MEKMEGEGEGFVSGRTLLVDERDGTDQNSLGSGSDGTGSLCVHRDTSRSHGPRSGIGRVPPLAARVLVDLFPPFRHSTFLSPVIHQ